MADAVEKAILQQVEKRLRSMLAEGVVLEDITAEVEAEDYLAKAQATTDPVLSAGYRKLAKKAGKK